MFSNLEISNDFGGSGISSSKKAWNITGPRPFPELIQKTFWRRQYA